MVYRCMGCPYRVPGCHSTCKDYISKISEKRAWEEEKNKDKEYIDYKRTSSNKFGSQK